LPLLFFSDDSLVCSYTTGFKGAGHIFSGESREKRKKVQIFKFRTMYADAEGGWRLFWENDPERKHEWTSFWKLKDDPRITRIVNS